MGKKIFAFMGQSNAGMIDKSGAPERFLEKYGIYAEVVEAYKGGTSLEYKSDGPDWNPDRLWRKDSGELIKSEFKDIEDALKANPGSELAGVYWCQGEGDSFHNGSQYGEWLNKLYDLFKDRFEKYYAGKNGEDFEFSVAKLSKYNFHYKNVKNSKINSREDETNTVWDSYKAFLKGQASLVKDEKHVKFYDPDAAVRKAFGLKDFDPSVKTDGNGRRIYDPDQHPFHKDNVHWNKESAEVINNDWFGQFYRTTTKKDWGNKYNWKEKNIAWDKADGKIAGKVTSFDDGTVKRQSYDSGKLVELAIVSKSGAQKVTKYDLDDRAWWASETTYYDKNGNVTDKKYNLNDWQTGKKYFGPAKAAALEKANDASASDAFVFAASDQDVAEDHGVSVASMIVDLAETFVSQSDGSSEVQSQDMSVSSAETMVAASSMMDEFLWA
jgi:hypothetical protein